MSITATDPTRRREGRYRQAEDGCGSGDAVIFSGFGQHCRQTRHRQPAYVVDTYDKLDQFRADPALWGPYSTSAESAGLMVADIVNYGEYGWATTTQVRTLADAKTVNVRIAEAPVNIGSYNA